MDAPIKCGVVIRTVKSWQALAAMTRHARGLDKKARRRRVRDGPRSFAMSKAADGWKECEVGEESPHTDLCAALKAHLQEPGVRADLRKGSPLAEHLIVTVGNAAVQSPEDEERLTMEAVAWAESAYGKGCVFAARRDLDERGGNNIDIFVAPKHKSRNKLVVSTYKSKRLLAEKWGRELDFAAAQDDWHAWAKERFDSRLVRGTPKAVSQRENLSPEEYGEGVDAVRAEIEAQRESVQQEREDLDAWAAQMRVEAEADRQRVLREREAAEADRRAALQSRRLAKAARQTERTLHNRQAESVARREHAVAEREARADAMVKTAAERKADLVALDSRVVALRAEAQRIVETNDALRAEAVEHDRVRLATMVASDKARAEAGILPSEAALVDAVGIDCGDGTGTRYRWRAAKHLQDVVLLMDADGREEEVATIRPHADDPFKTLRLFPLGNMFADAIKFARKGDAATELGAGLVAVFKTLLRAGRVPRVVSVEQERGRGLGQ